MAYVIQRPSLPGGTCYIDFPAEDAAALAAHAVASQAWQFRADYAPDAPSYDGRRRVRCETMVAISDPTGRVGVWFGALHTRSVTLAKAAFASTYDADLAAFWAVSKNRGGPRNITPLAKAAGRALFRRAFALPADARDDLLGAMTRWETRPTTRVLLTATDTALEAATALRACGAHGAARNLLHQAARARRCAIPHVGY